ncbi:hypothetical protein [Nocardia sp. CA-120079]|uniref:hypothetical protein n=1 Tax=Nocardia sp. CA-120079 TaxID=3239974 RepID=UPI003D9A03E7
MEGSAEAYERLLSLISEWLPEVAAQIRTEVGRGAPRSEPTAPARGWMLDTFEGRIEPFKRGTDVSVRNYSADEQLAILVDALRTVAATMLESRQVLLQFFGSTDDTADQGQIRVTFVDPVSAESTESLSATHLAETEELVTATQKLTEALDAVRAPR